MSKFVRFGLLTEGQLFMRTIRPGVWRKTSLQRHDTSQGSLSQAHLVFNAERLSVQEYVLDLLYDETLVRPLGIEDQIRFLAAHPDFRDKL